MMSWQHLEKIFNRSLSRTFSKRKCLLVFPVLAFCGLLSVLCRILAQGARHWIQMSLTFLPIFLCAGLLLAAGLVLIRIYAHEVKGESVNYFRVLKGAKGLMMGIPYLSLPLIFTYLVLWMVLGIFYLMRAIPNVGELVGSLFSFGPFLLVLGSILLGILCLVLLFFVTPAAALGTELTPQLVEKILAELKENPFLSVVMLLMALLPLLLLIGLLSLSAVMTQILYVGPGPVLTIALKWFVIMIPFCALLTPAVIFFFNFSAESRFLMRKALSSK